MHSSTEGMDIKSVKGAETLKTSLGSVDAIFFHKPEEPFGFLSNWYLAGIELEGKKFSSTEQYIMYRKCQILKDDKAAKAVLSTDDPSKQQNIARYTTNYDEQIWDSVRQAVAMKALIAKFTQNPELNQKLQDTRDTYLVECAWSDKTWACGIGLDSEDKNNMSKWKGRNLLGFALMEVRHLLCKSLSEIQVPSEEEHVPCSNIYLKQGDITKLDCDCIVNAANNSLLGGGGVDGAIHRAAGPELLRECRTLNGCKTGEAKITKGYNLPARHIIHTVGPIYSGNKKDAELLESCYISSLELAKEKGIHSIAFCAISTGVYRYPLEDATLIAVNAVKRWLDENVDYAMDVIFCCYDNETYNVYDSILRNTL